jgi:RNA recognition motif. (a.k.a. RRM, RBD, or RNP domain)
VGSKNCIRAPDVIPGSILAASASVGRLDLFAPIFGQSVEDSIAALSVGKTKSKEGDFLGASIANEDLSSCEISKAHPTVHERSSAASLLAHSTDESCLSVNLERAKESLRTEVCIPAMATPSEERSRAREVVNTPSHAVDDCDMGNYSSATTLKSRSQSSSKNATFEGPEPPNDYYGESREPQFHSAWREKENLHKSVAKILAVNPSDNYYCDRPRVCTDAGVADKDLLYLSNLPTTMTYDKLRELVEPFGEVSLVMWDANESSVAEIIYVDPVAAEEAFFYLNDSIVGDDDDLPLSAELRGREPGTSLFVGDLTPDVTEVMLENEFSKLVKAPVTASLKLDPGNSTPIGYGALFSSKAHIS